jgi:hypothetical protein
MRKVIENRKKDPGGRSAWHLIPKFALGTGRLGNGELKWLEKLNPEFALGISEIMGGGVKRVKK